MERYQYCAATVRVLFARLERQWKAESQQQPSILVIIVFSVVVDHNVVFGPQDIDIQVMHLLLLYL